MAHRRRSWAELNHGSSCPRASQGRMLASRLMGQKMVVSLLLGTLFLGTRQHWYICIFQSINTYQNAKTLNDTLKHTLSTSYSLTGTKDGHLISVLSMNQYYR
jgi:hypothetical protein